ncbi:MAG: Asp23/Gls24 family envelope stress response protein [Clostridia bacterium]|nr:Asp23/Gls24 family envelope stress response protein [Clostridia bacterium]
MPGVIVNDLGKITMNEDLVASIAGYAAVENYGIVGMSSKTATDTILQLVGGDNVKRGVKVAMLESGTAVDIDLFVTLEYGVSLPAVARNVIQNVRYRVSEMTGLTVNNVNVHVEAIRV